MRMEGVVARECSAAFESEAAVGLARAWLGTEGAVAESGERRAAEMMSKAGRSRVEEVRTEECVSPVELPGRGGAYAL